MGMKGEGWDKHFDRLRLGRQLKVVMSPWDIIYVPGRFGSVRFDLLKFGL